MQNIQQIVWRVLMVAAVLACGACGGDDDDSTVQQEPVTGRHGGFVVSFSLTEENPVLAEQIGASISALLSKSGSGIAGATTITQVQCPPGAQTEGETAACYDARVRLPFVHERNVPLLEDMIARSQIGTALRSNLTYGSLFSSIKGRGFAWGDNMALLFAMRNMLDIPPDTVAAVVKTMPVQSATNPKAVPASTSTVTVDVLKWQDSTQYRIGDSDGYERRVLAPDFSGVDGSSGSWVLYGLGAWVQDGNFKCLKGQFKHLDTGATQTVSDGDCGSTEQYVELADPKVATGVAIDVDDNNVTGLGLAYGTPTYTVDPADPDFLTGVSSSSYQFSGSGRDMYAPPTSQLDESYKYVVVGVSAVAKSEGVSDMTVYQGKLTSSAPSSSDYWQQYTVSDIEAAVTSVLNQVYDTVAENVTFDIVSGCPSTIPSLNFCDSLAASGEYSTSALDDACSGVCDATYETCKVSYDACKVSCCYGCLWGNWCTCDYSCSSVREGCYDGCTNVFSGSAAVKVVNVTGLEELEISNATIPLLSTSSTEASIYIEADATISAGLTAHVYWKLCQSGLCFSDTSPMSSSNIRAHVSGTLTAKTCTSGPPALYLSISGIEIIETGLWGVDDFAEIVVGVVDSSMDWLADNISDIFYNDLQDDYEKAIDSVLSSVEDELNSILTDTPVLPCQ